MPKRGIKRLVTAVLAVFLFAAALPAPVSAEEATAEEIKNQITTIYKKAKSRSGKSNFNGLCGSFVNWQAYLLGIDSSFQRCSGKQEYDTRSAVEMTDTGYYTRCFPDDDYTLESALNAITLNGTRNAYNLVVGFQWTRTESGKKYGHTCFIHAIIDGVVYYMESDPVRVAGRYYASGKVITATIKEFAADYKSWTDFEGVVEYIKAPYEERCESIATDIYVQTTQQTPLRTEPCDFAVENIGEDTRTIRTGEIFKITTILRNPEGEYWYKAADGAYFKAEAATLLSGQFDSVTVKDLSVPELLAEGEGFPVSGTAASGGSVISVLRGQIYSGVGGTGVLLQNAAVQAEGTSVSLSRLNEELRFEELEQGTYHFALSAVVYDLYVENGTLQRRWRTVDLWTAEFAVTQEPESYTVAELDLQGGENAPQQVVLAQGESLQQRTQPQRTGYSFDGWTESEGAYSACWSLHEEALNGWRWVDGAWRFYRRGVQCAGWLEVCGISYYFDADGPLEAGWLELDGQKFYLYENGSAATGTVVVDGISYIFDEHGVLRSQPDGTGA